MWTKQQRPEIADHDEDREVAALKAAVARAGDAEQLVASHYWGSLIARTNERIDSATSAKALSISWAARVAIPGVLAILFFFIGLHYYAPDLPRSASTISGVLNTLPAAAIDSIMLHPEELSSTLSATEYSQDIFEFTGEQLSDYMSATATHETLVETMDDTDVTSLLIALDSKKNL
jgi:hypothetical protein